jgi:hypothetical protein
VNVGVADEDVDDGPDELDELDVAVPIIMLLELELGLELDDIEDDRADDDELIMALDDEAIELELSITLEEDGVHIVLLLIP